MKKLLIILSSILLFSSLESCKCNEDFDLDRDFAIGFNLFDKDSQKDLLIITSVYHPDSVKIYNESDALIYPGLVPGGGSVYFSPYKFIEAEIPIDKDVTDYYYLHLQERGLDIDTFKLEYKATLDECNEKIFTYLNFYYNEELVFESETPRFDFYVELFK